VVIPLGVTKGCPSGHPEEHPKFAPASAADQPQARGSSAVMVTHASTGAPEAERLLDRDAGLDDVVMAAFADGWHLGLLAGAQRGTAA
jgi:hypothetical protein